MTMRHSHHLIDEPALLVLPGFSGVSLTAWKAEPPPD